jgi:hypothetical protein
MKLEVLGLLGLGGVAAMFLASPDAVLAREAMWAMVTGMVTR